MKLALGYNQFYSVEMIFFFNHCSVDLVKLLCFQEKVLAFFSYLMYMKNNDLKISSFLWEENLFLKHIEVYTTNNFCNRPN